MSTPEPVLPPFPDGWYFLARADEVPAGAVLTRRLAGEDVVLFRGGAGAVAAVRPHCPHLGAHLGRGGRVDGDDLRCPMHGFCFDARGRCTRTGYGTSPPPRATLDVHHVRERDGLILVWYASGGRAPAWEVPARSQDGFATLRTRTIECAGHPQETSENSVDLGHLDHVHGFVGAAMTGPLAIDGPRLTATFSFDRRPPWGERPLLRVHYQACVHGLGYSFVDVELPELGMRTQQYVLATPTDEGRLIAEVATRAILFGYEREVERDVEVWAHKAYRPRPALAQGDGPVGAYRRWARQFYGAAGVGAVADA